MNIKKLQCGLLLFLLIIGCSTHPEPLIIQNVTVISGPNMEPRHNQTIIVRGQIISEIVDSADPIELPAGKIIDGSELYAIPGLWDTHVHLSKVKEEALPIFVANGITSVRDMGSVFQEVQKMRGKIESGELQGPTIITPGPILEAPETIERIKSQETLEDYQQQRIPIPDSISAFAVVDSLKRLGVDFIKVREYASLSAYRGIAEAARQVNLDLVGHPPFGLDPVEAANTLDMETWEHASYPYPLPKDENKLEELLKAIKTNNIAVVPTLATWRLYITHPDSVRKFLQDTLGQHDPRRILISAYHAKEMSLELKDKQPKTSENLKAWKGFIDQTARDMKTFHDAGIEILPGSDQSSSVLIPGYSLHEEMELMQHMIGLTPAEILKSATYTSSKVFHMADSLGSIEEGKLANIVLLSKNPLENIQYTRFIKYVINKGQLLNEEEISTLLKRLTPRTRSKIDYIQQ